MTNDSATAARPLAAQEPDLGHSLAKWPDAPQNMHKLLSNLRWRSSEVSFPSQLSLSEMLGAFPVGFEPKDDDDDVGGWDELPKEVALQLDMLPVVLDDVTGLDLVWRVILSLRSQ